VGLEGEQVGLGVETDAAVLLVRQNRCSLQTLPQKFAICADNAVCVGRNDAAVLREAAVNQLSK
jgi:hypothetical protein